MGEDDRLIHMVYEAAANPDYWMETGRRIAEFANGGSVHLLLASLETGDEYLSLFARGDPSFASEYLRDYAETDFRIPKVMGRRLGLFVDEREYVSIDEARRSAIHQDLLPNYAIHNISGANMSLDGCIGWFGISTRASHDEFDPRTRRFLERLAPHIVNAFRIVKAHFELNLSHELSFASTDLVNGGILILRGDVIVHVNPAARKLLDEGFFTIRNGQLACRQPSEQAKLTEFLRRHEERKAEDSLLLRRYELGAAYTIRLHELRSTHAPSRLGKNAPKPRAISIVEMNVPANPRLEEVVAFCSGYDVSYSEAMVVHAVVSSTSLAEYAETKRVSLYTVQQQLKSAMLKMNLNSQKKIFQAYERYRIFSAIDN